MNQPLTTEEALVEASRLIRTQQLQLEAAQDRIRNLEAKCEALQNDGPISDRAHSFWRIQVDILIAVNARLQEAADYNLDLYKKQVEITENLKCQIIGHAQQQGV